MHEYFSNFKKFIILKKIMWKKNFIWWKTSSFLGKIFNGKILRFFRQKWPLFWSKFLYFGYPENISGFRVLNVGFRVGFGYRPLGFRLGSGGLKCRVYPSGFRVFGSPDTSLLSEELYQPYDQCTYYQKEFKMSKKSVQIHEWIRWFGPYSLLRHWF